MNRNEYCDRVLAQVGRLTADEANDLRNELAGHIEDHAEALVEHGYTEDAAYGRAVALMGDPEETGRALCAQYGGWWLVIVQRAARILTAVLCVMIAGLIVKSSGLYGAIRDRITVQKPSDGWEIWNTETPGTRIPIGEEPDELIDHLKNISLFHKYFPSGTGDIFPVDVTVHRNPQYVLDIVRGAMRMNIRYLSFYARDSDTIRITGYLVKRSEMEKLDRGETVVQNTPGLGLGAAKNCKVLDRRVR